MLLKYFFQIKIVVQIDLLLLNLSARYEFAVPVALRVFFKSNTTNL